MQIISPPSATTKADPGTHDWPGNETNAGNADPAASGRPYVPVPPAPPTSANVTMEPSGALAQPDSGPTVAKNAKKSR